jgi:hypothetical protein
LISLCSVTLALTLILLGAVVVSGLTVCGIPKPFVPGGAGMVTVGTSGFFSEVWALLENATKVRNPITVREIVNKFFISQEIF